MSPGVKQISCRAPANGAEENRLVWRTSLSRQTKRSRMEWKVGAGARKVRLLLWIAQVECQLSLAPPISTNILWSADAHKAISFHAHCPLGRAHQHWWRRVYPHPRESSSTRIKNFVMRSNSQGCWFIRKSRHQQIQLDRQEKTEAKTELTNLSTCMQISLTQQTGEKQPETFLSAIMWITNIIRSRCVSTKPGDKAAMRSLEFMSRLALNWFAARMEPWNTSLNFDVLAFICLV